MVAAIPDSVNPRHEKQTSHLNQAARLGKTGFKKNRSGLHFFGNLRSFDSLRRNGFNRNCGLNCGLNCDFRSRRFHDLFLYRFGDFLGRCLFSDLLGSLLSGRWLLGGGFLLGGWLLHDTAEFRLFLLAL